MNASDEYLKAPWAFKAGDKVLEEGPRAAMYQLMCVDHCDSSPRADGRVPAPARCSAAGPVWTFSGWAMAACMAGIKTLKLNQRRDVMKTNVHLDLQANATRRSRFYEKVFGTKRQMTMKYSDAPAGTPVPPDAKDLVMHTSIAGGKHHADGSRCAAGDEASRWAAFRSRSRIRTRRR